MRAVLEVRSKLSQLALISMLLAGGFGCRDSALALTSGGRPDAAATTETPSADDPSVAGSNADSQTATLPPEPKLPDPPFSSDQPVSVWVRGGTVVDGTGAPPRRADVVVRGDRIIHVGAVVPELSAAQIIDATGRFVSPGFIDAHSHGDPTQACENFLAQGVTTLVVGQDGRSPGASIAAWIARVTGGLRLHVVVLAGHATIRQAAGIGHQPATAAQLERAQALLERELEAGAVGLSQGLEYTPGRLSTSEELVAFARPVAAFDGVIMSHLRSEDDDRIDASIDELVEQANTTGARVHVAHLKVVYGKGAARADQLLDRFVQLRKGGVKVTADLYPYEASYTGIDIVFPDFAKPPHSFREVVKNERPRLEKYLRDRIHKRNGPGATLFGTGTFAGKTLEEVARERGKPFEDVLIDDVGPGGVSAAYFVMDRALQDRLFMDPEVMVGTDASGGSRHPRGHGSFVRVVTRFARDERLLTLEEVVRRMTSLPAKTLRIERDVGTLATGRLADIAVFDLDKLADRASFASPHALAEGVEWVLVGGRVVREEGRPRAGRAGQVLRAHRPCAPGCTRE